MHKKAVSGETAFFVPLPLPNETNSRTNRPPKTQKQQSQAAFAKYILSVSEKYFSACGGTADKKTKKFLSAQIARYQPISDTRQLFVPKNSL